MKLQSVVAHLNELLKTGEIKDYPNALNGLQVKNSGEVTRVGAAVDGCEETLRMAVEAGVDLLLVHHGLFWNGLAPVTGPGYRKLKLALDNNLAIYSAHLPLDYHPELGNNALLCEAMEFDEFEPVPGFGMIIEAEINREILHARIEKAVGGGLVHLAAGGPVVSRRIGVVTGGAGAKVTEAEAFGIDTLITGEGPHWTFTAAEELGVNLFYAGHYATETFGVKALGEHLEEKFDLPWEFLDHPTSL